MSTMSKSLDNLPCLFPGSDQTIAGAGRALRAGRTNCVQILNGCLARVDEWEPTVHAWVVLDRERALEQARALDDELRAGKDRGSLHGIPIGIKDIIDVAGLPTACGSKRWSNRIADSDANIVANLHEAGAVIMGKTVTTPYAWIDPPVTRNPWNLERTPGGSSSGSVAAVACGMCLGAIGTQTGGSITRPASFCGVAGMKPTQFAAMMLNHGVSPFARSLDHVGPIARTVDDLRILFIAMDDSRSTQMGDSCELAPRQDPPRLGRLRGYFENRAERIVRTGFDDAVRGLAAQGTSILEVDGPVDFERVLEDHRRVMAAEAAEIHSDWLDEFPHDYPPRIRDLILEGRSVTELEYLKAKDGMSRAKDSIVRTVLLAKLDALITPATVSTAVDVSSTGDPAFNSPWSYTGLPTVSFPTGVAADGLPIAIQLVGVVWRDRVLLRTAEWCERAMRAQRQ
jgi:aspartyl-tRNA(Asn)/glutamyl-tRNA(Gln) amidotransferase subunit A